MIDPRVRKVAKTLVEHSTKVQKGDVVQIIADNAAQMLALEVYKLVLQKGAYPLVHLGLPEASYYYYKFASEEQLKNFPKVRMYELKNSDDPEKQEVVRIIDSKTGTYTDKKQFFIDKVAEGVGRIAAGFYPNDVIVRLSDFKSNEYANLVGGKFYEPEEENPMIGWRGASRYYDPKYRPAFELECEGLKKARNDMGLHNIKLMVPFCRTPDEGKKVVEVMKDCGLVQGENGLELYVMCEIPSNVISADAFADIFDGFSIGSNDLTQLTFGLDRDSGLIAGIADERDESVKDMIRMVMLMAKAWMIRALPLIVSCFPDILFSSSIV